MKSVYIVLVVMAFISCHKPDTNEPINPDLLTVSARKTVSANNAFAFDFFNKINELETQEKGTKLEINDNMYDGIGSYFERIN